MKRKSTNVIRLADKKRIKKPDLLSDSLPFVKSLGRGKGYDYWAVEPTGRYFEDCETGTRYAEMLLALTRTNFNVTLLGPIARDMIAKGPAEGDGIVIGFMATIGRTAFGFRALLAEAGVGT